ncbi:hypothetical protein HU200_040882 [Digitaria exilis]|uniref:F-box domain-containing protein n=1 Tax=Digitaria exilis TaxID=1010633 RepID=A0A835B879_9POAL|nr:hypothetical protein HU200_040882 [Digitaria exilis]
MRSLMTHAALDEKWARFEDFATNLLLFHDNTSSLDEFLVFAHVYNQRHVDRWIRRGIEYCPAVLRILMPGTDLAFKLPPMASSSFHRLKRLCLQNLDLDGQFTHLLSTFPVMEYLELTLCEFTGDCSQGITLSTLKKLVLDCCDNKTSRPMVIMAPSLSCLNLSFGCYLAGIALSKMDSLAEAMIDVLENQTMSQKTQRGLLGSLFNVTSLELSGFETKMMNPEPTTGHVGGPTDAMDPLSALPDGLLHVIMSFLPAPQVVQTSLLSRRWRCLWRSTPCIEINDENFGISAQIRDGTLSERWARFEDFATNLLLFHDNTSSLGEFRLHSLNYNFRHAQIDITEYEALSQKDQRELLGSLFNVTSLKLIGFEEEVMLNKNYDKFPIFSNMRTLCLNTCFRNECEISYMDLCVCQKFFSFSDSEWETERETIALHREHGRPFQCPKLKLVEVIYHYDHDHQLMEFVLGEVIKPEGVTKMQPETSKKPAGDLTSPVDRLSALPDALLHAILSFVPAPQAVRT